MFAEFRDWYAQVYWGGEVWFDVGGSMNVFLTEANRVMEPALRFRRLLTDEQLLRFLDEITSNTLG